VERAVLRSRVPAVLEYDDAVFHRYDSSSHQLVRALLGSKIARLMREATTVVAGNPYLAEHAGEAGARCVEIVPTAIDTERVTVPERATRQPATIGWIGTPPPTRYLRAVEGALGEVSRDGRARVLLVGAEPIELAGVPVVARPWSEEAEPADLAEMDIGIMPLPDSPWERGKSGFKLLQYMAAGCPVVASPVGVDNSIVKPGVNGFLASTEEQWRESLAALSENASLRQRPGSAGWRLVEAEYSASVTAPKVLRILREATVRNP
jgi:glycosyltransferase involved in cell wall biosynthesis